MKKRPIPARIILVSDRIGRAIETAVGSFCVLIYAAMIAAALLGVLFRYVMLSPFEWTEEVARFLMLWVGFLAMNIALRRNEHIAINFLGGRVPPGARRLIGYGIDLLVGLFLYYLLKQGYLMTTQTLITTGTLNISMFWIYMAVPLGALLTLIQLVLNVAMKVMKEFAPEG
ncbi:MAG: TRAP transporter small permease, partial [Deltaproteobacteria bacterium]|nr:TRAP transporter small permease [Deltaproteobacteria bacterium]